MQHGGNTTPSASFNNNRRYLNLPSQANQGSSPTLTLGSIISANATYSNDITNVNWTVDEYKSPQLIAKIEIIDDMNNIVKTEEYTLPEKRSAAINYHLNNGKYVIKITLTDIFNQTSVPAMYHLTVNNMLFTIQRLECC